MREVPGVRKSYPVEGQQQNQQPAEGPPPTGSCWAGAYLQNWFRLSKAGSMPCSPAFCQALHASVDFFI